MIIFEGIQPKRAIEPTVSTRLTGTMLHANRDGNIGTLRMGPSAFLSTDILALLNRSVASRTRRQIEMGCLVFTLVTGFVDYLAGRDVTIAFIYAFPISIAAWFLGAEWAFPLALLSVALWVGGDIALGLYSGATITIVNSILRLGFYVLLIIGLVRLSRLQRGMEQRSELRAQALARETAERQRLEQEMIHVSEREQRRIGQDLHDGLCQHLTGTALAGHALAETLAGATRSEAASARKIVDLIEEAIEMARGTAKGLDPVKMEAEGLMLALDEFAATTSDIFGIRCKFVCRAPVFIHNPASATHLYRIAQEAVSNALKHGHARKIVIVLEETDSGIRLAVRNDGDGMPVPLPDNRGMGLRIMADRAKLIGGQFAIVGNGKRGVEMTCLIPSFGISQESQIDV